MALVFGIVVFALGILVSVCLHEAGHMGTAKAFGMKVTRYFVGFGPTLFSFRRGETEYGVKAIPLGGFVKIVGMTPQDDDVEPGDEKRAMWRFPVWKRTIVMSAGSISHFILAFVALWVLFAFVGVPDDSKINSAPATVGAVLPCVSDFKVDPATKQAVACKSGSDPASPASKAGLRTGDVITKINDQRISNFAEMRTTVQALANQNVTLTYTHDGKTQTRSVFIPVVQRPKATVNPNTPVTSIKPADLEPTGMIGISPKAPLVTFGPVESIGLTGKQIGRTVVLTFSSLKQIPEKIPALVKAIFGAERDPNTPVSVVGASHIGGQLISIGDWTSVLSLFAVLNLFFGIFNLMPLLPMDGGHIAIAWFERVRSWIAARRGRPDPGRVDYMKLTPITLAVISVLGVFVLLTATADVVNPITLPK
ncbi:M50 family metallopeptidase [Planosporangium mesophilum]|uniref:Zn-dependent protease n=1 Tax=Planosporangium mesophilum TaxID=689768 RepID=A0A8J3T4Y3_9ACTN|nr:site-2 protease family protein [Planosporangium mesophilum]NJC81718.1 site-2 protease family protein [Planosporangium mesophilum]GII20620.1 Zn-dependent protease [Planosporangium mesophilum]